MIPLHLKISGFLSYHETVEINFTDFELACIAGPNGAGKSSLLDAITWNLFGIARKRDDTLINTHPDVKAAEVSFIFAYEGNIYRVQRAAPRGKTTQLEFHILQEGGVETSNGRGSLSSFNVHSPAVWKPLTERIVRDTQSKIESTLRMDYNTFVNASFFLQGKADQFTQQRPSDRKRILGSILGLEIWETYRQGAADRRKAIETEITAIDARLQDIQLELDEEQERRANLKARQSELDGLAKRRETQEKTLETVRRIAEQLSEQRKWVDARSRQLETATAKLRGQQERWASLQKECDSYQRIIVRAPEIEARFKTWQQARADIEYWDDLARNFREGEKRRQGPLDEINAERAGLAQELQTLQRERQAVEASRSEITDLQEKIQSIQQSVAQAEQQVAQRTILESEQSGAQQMLAEARAENGRLKVEMEELKERIRRLSSLEGATCPLCGQPLDAESRQKHIDELQTHGKEMGDRFRQNGTLIRERELKIQGLKTQIEGLSKIEAILRVNSGALGQATGRLDSLVSHQRTWEQQGEARLGEVSRRLEQESFAEEARSRLAEIDAQLKTIGYDASTHDRARKAEAEGRPSDLEMRNLERAQAALAPVEREIAALEKSIAADEAEVERLQGEYAEAAASLAAAEAQAPDLYTAERELQDLLEQENRLRMEVGAARQKVEVLADLKRRQKGLLERREEQAQRVSQYKQLERAFGKDGVPALLIEQALPQIESRANEILDRLSDGAMSVRFVTQASYKDKKRDDLRETLDIQISDSAGTRDYELFSGGEAFRVNFAIRLALSEILAQRAGARLQTLVIDEGFGSQDAQGRQRLVEAINLVREDFAKILVITHIDELKDAFPNRIEVEKTPRGSQVRVI